MALAYAHEHEHLNRWSLVFQVLSIRLALSYILNGVFWGGWGAGNLNLRKLCENGNCDYSIYKEGGFFLWVLVMTLKIMQSKTI